MWWCVVEEDTLAAIEKRMQEIKLMTRPKRDTRPVIERLEPSIRDRILVTAALITSWYPSKYGLSTGRKLDSITMETDGCSLSALQNVQFCRAMSQSCADYKKQTDTFTK